MRVTISCRYCISLEVMLLDLVLYTTASGYCATENALQNSDHAIKATKNGSCFTGQLFTLCYDSSLFCDDSFSTGGIDI